MQSQVKTGSPVRGVPRIPMDTTFTIISSTHYWRITNIVTQREKPSNIPVKSHKRYRFKVVTASLRFLMRSYKRGREPLTGYDIEARLNQAFNTTFNAAELNMIFTDVARILRHERRYMEIRLAKTRHRAHSA